ncbi:NAD(+) synthase [Hyalangium versicolor]|uniref:NAD(+) synthase n=1 Tax=Hyalangium versicolor TaxID=2861190 RepID=UPI001CC9060A|nr:NAD(+) synthase [Hyalangium versicolor]
MISAQSLAIDAPAVVEQITHAIRTQVLGTLRRRGVVVGVSGGVDSAVVTALCVRALGADRVLALLMPERDSSEDALRLGREVANTLGVETLVEDITPALEGLNCYRRQEEAIRQVFPEYGKGWRCKLSLPPFLEGERLNIFQLTVQEPGGTRHTSRLPASAYLQLVAATNFKQRVRKLLEYYHADRLHRAVVGTPNRLEYDQGFFVKQGDGAADLKPIAHLYKTQVYALAECLGIPEEVRRRPPTTDTFSLPQTQEEFFFSLPYAQMDLCLYAHDHGVPEDETASALGLTPRQVVAVYRDIEAKRRSTRYLHEPPLLVQPVREG